MIRKANKYNINDVYKLICEIEQFELNYILFEEIYKKQLSND